jgi:hypothetical protein
VLKFFAAHFEAPFGLTNYLIRLPIPRWPEFVNTVVGRVLVNWKPCMEQVPLKIALSRRLGLVVTARCR